MSLIATPSAAGDTNHRTIADGLRRSTVIALTAFLTVVDLFATQAILPTLTRAYGVTPAAMSLAVNASTFGMAVASLAIAFFAQRIDGRRGILFSLGFLSIPTLLLAVAPNLAAFAALRVVQGLFMASAFTLTLAYLGKRYAAADAASAFAAYITGNVASNLFGRLMSAGIADHFGLATNFVVFALLNLAGAALVYATVKQGSSPMVAATNLTPWSSVARHLQNPSLRCAFAIGFCILFAFIGTFTYVNFVLVRPPLGLGMMSLGFVYFVFLPSIATTPLGGRIALSLGPRAAIGSGLGLAGVGLPLLLAPALPIVIVGLGLVAVGTFLAQAVVTAFVARAASVDREAASGIYLASYFSGGLVGTAVLGRVFDNLGWPACVAGVGTSLAIAAMLASRLRMPSSD